MLNVNISGTARGMQMATLFAASLGFATAAQASITTDSHGNEGYSTAEECDKAVLSGTANFYKSFTFQPPLKRAGEASHKVVDLGDVAGYELGACDRGVGRSNDRSGVSAKLIGTYVPYSPEMDVNAYSDSDGNIVRLMMQQCDNNFGAAMPRAVQGVMVEAQPAPVGVASDCSVNILVPAKFETRTDKVVKVPATKRYDVVPATYKTITEKVVVQPESLRQIPVPATYKTLTEKVVVKPGTVRREPVAPTFKTVTKKVLVTPESTSVRVIPATYKTVPNRSIKKEASKRLVPYAAQFETVTERVQVAEGYKVWKRGRAWIGQAIDVQPLRGFKVGSGVKVEDDWSAADNTSLEDDVMCLVEVPPQFATITRKKMTKPAGVREEAVPAEYCNCTKQVVDQPARTESVKIPAVYRTVQSTVVDKPAEMREVPIEAVYETVTRTVIDKPASFREERIPAVYETLSRRVVDTAAKTTEVAVPAVYETLSYRVKVSDARTERRQILCETNATPAKIREIQEALKKAGHNPGPINGSMRAQTMSAVNSYQRAKGLPVDGYLNIETVKALGVSPE